MAGVNVIYQRPHCWLFPLVLLVPFAVINPVSINLDGKHWLFRDCPRVGMAANVVTDSCLWMDCHRAMCQI